MNFIYLARHGETYSLEEDFDRSINEQGRLDVENVANILKQKNIVVKTIFHSSKQRSKQTAEIIARVLNLNSKLVLLDLLDSENNINQLSQYIDNLKENALLVGHLPTLDILTSYLISLGTRQLSFSYSPGSVACLKHENDMYSLEWFVSPSEGKGMI